MKTALISVSDKTGLGVLAPWLSDHSFAIVATGSTAGFIRRLGIAVRDVAEVTGVPEMLGGRVKTLHPAIHGGILAPATPEARAELDRLGIAPIDLVVCNLYPFEEAARKQADESALIEEIDIGGVTLLRAAAKNHARVTILSDPRQYPDFMAGWSTDEGGVSAAMRRELAVAAFRQTAFYDALIAQTLQPATWPPPTRWALPLRQVMPLRYGENPHQPAMLFGVPFAEAHGVPGFRVHGGKELSYNNLADLDAALGLVMSLDGPAAVIVKHAQPCGVAQGTTLAQAYERALAADPVSAYGGIVALNRPVDAATADLLHETPFLECIAAPDYDAEVLPRLLSKKTRRYLTVPAGWSPLPVTLKTVAGGFLAQSPDWELLGPVGLAAVGAAGLPEGMESALRFAYRVAQAVMSNGIALVKDGATVGLCGGQTNRVDAIRMACERAGERAKGAILASDGFLPNPDNVEMAAGYGIAVIVQPGGSKYDPEVFAAAEKAGIAMVLAGNRHFRH